MKQVLLLTLAVIGTLGMMKAQITITDDDLEPGQTYNWTSDNEYMLDGLVYLEDGGTLNIEPGTVIRGKEIPSDTNDNTSALIIARGAKIEAEGEENDPIIFTAEIDNLNGNLLPDDCGQWGGVIVLGKAPIYSEGNTEVSIEGIPSGEPRGRFGGNNPSDNSGTIKYVSIRHTGVGIAPGSEIQGLTLGGVGNGTTIDYVECYASCDDGVEIFGGTVDIKHFVVSFATDDSYDFDIGWKGIGQYLFAMQLQGTGEDYDKAGEWDGAKPDNAPVYSQPDIANATFIGPGQNSSGAQNAIVMRDAWGGTLYNSILADFPGVGIEVEDLESGIDAYGRLDSNIVISNLTWSAFAGASTTDELIKVTDGNPTEPNASTLKAHLDDNDNTVVDNNVLAGIGRFPGSESLDPRPTSNYQNTATVPSSLTQENYRGAFDPNEENWMKGWTALDAYNFIGDLISGVNDIEAQGYSVNGIAPNPASHNARVSFTLPENANVSLEITDITGRVLRNTSEGNLARGTHQVNLDVEDLNAGIYFVSLKAGNGQITRKLVIQ